MKKYLVWLDRDVIRFLIYSQVKNSVGLPEWMDLFKFIKLQESWLFVFYWGSLGI